MFNRNNMLRLRKVAGEKTVKTAVVRGKTQTVHPKSKVLANVRLVK
jgi:hypothetical protein